MLILDLRRADLSKWYWRVVVKLFGKKRQKVNTVRMATDIYAKLEERNFPKGRKCLKHGCKNKLFDPHVYPWQFCPDCLKNILGED